MSRTSVLAIALSISHVVCGLASASELKPADILAKARPASVTVVAYGVLGEQISLGSGFVATQDGLIVTCRHVIEGASSIRVFRHTGAYWTAQRVVAQDTQHDYAILKVAGKDLPTIPLGDSDAVRQGDRILVLSSPLGLAQTASDGIISAVRKSAQGVYLLQTTAAISPGSSGGPVLDSRGRVIGIALLRISAGESLNFAVPVNAIKAGLKSANVNHTAVPSANITGRLGVVTALQADIKSYPGSQGRVLHTCPKETYLALIGQNGDWYGVLMIDSSTGWIEKRRVDLLNYEVKGDVRATLGDRIAYTAVKCLRVPYEKGGMSMQGMDAAGLLQYVYAQHNSHLPKDLKAQTRVGKLVEWNRLQAGDRLYFAEPGKAIDGAGIYVGNGLFVHASEREKGVVIDRLSDKAYVNTIVCARR